MGRHGMTHWIDCYESGLIVTRYNDLVDLDPTTATGGQ